MIDMFILGLVLAIAGLVVLAISVVILLLAKLLVDMALKGEGKKK